MVKQPKVVGSGASHMRIGLQREFPVIRENIREFRKSRAFVAGTIPITTAISALLALNSLKWEQGIFAAEQGNCAADQGKREAILKANLAGKRTPKPAVPLNVVVALFRQNLKRGPWPNANHCYYLRNTIDHAANALPAKVLNSDPAYRRRRTTISSMQKLIRKQLERDPFPGIRFPGEIVATDALEQLDKALQQARSALLAPFDPLAGERRGAAWHKPARFIAGRVEEALIKAGRKKVSFDKHSPAVRVVIGAMILAGERERTPEAVAAAFAASPPPKYV